MHKHFYPSIAESNPNSKFKLKLGALQVLFLTKLSLENEKYSNNKCLSRILSNLDNY